MSLQSGGTLKSLQHHSSKASVLWCLAFFMVQLSHPIHDYWKNHSFDYRDLCWQNDSSTFYIRCLDLEMEKAMAPHSSTPAWRIPRIGEPGGLFSVGSHRVGHD